MQCGGGKRTLRRRSGRFEARCIRESEVASNSRSHRISWHRGNGYGHIRIRATQQVVKAARFADFAGSGVTADGPRTRPEDTAAGSNTHHGRTKRNAVFPDRMVMGLLDASQGAHGEVCLRERIRVCTEFFLHARVFQVHLSPCDDERPTSRNRLKAGARQASEPGRH